MTWNSQTPRRRLNQGLFGGVCAGLANQFGLNLTGVRLAVVVCALFATTITVLSYGIAWILMRKIEPDLHARRAPYLPNDLLVQFSI